MATKIKGIYKGFKFISQIFVVKEREMEIGYPTDVKHVAHIGWDGPSGTAPSWMNDFKTPPDFSSTTIANTKDPTSIANFSPWSSQVLDQTIGNQAAMSMSSLSNNIIPSSDPPNLPKKSKRKKKSTSSSPTSLCSSSRSSLAIKSKGTYHELDSTPNLHV